MLNSYIIKEVSTSPKLQNLPINGPFRTIEDYKSDYSKYSSNRKRENQEKMPASPAGQNHTNKRQFKFSPNIAVDRDSTANIIHDGPSHVDLIRKELLAQEAREQKMVFVGYSRKLQQLVNKKYEALSSFLRDKSGDTFFRDTIDSATIQDLLQNDQTIFSLGHKSGFDDQVYGYTG